MNPISDSTLWDVRTFIYHQFAETTRPPDVAAVAQAFGFDEATAVDHFHKLDRLHAIFLEPGTTDIRIANPFSAVPTGFRVHSRGRTYWANCAWDSLGIPVALHADAVIEASCAEDGRPLVLEVADGQVMDTTAVAHFLVPFQRWYEDMTYT